MKIVKTDQEISIMRRGGSILKEVLQLLSKEVKDGVRCSYINELAGTLLKERGAEPSFLNYQGFPANICVSLNDEVVHGIPDEKRFEDGDVVSLDLGVKYRGMHTDAALTVGCGMVSAEAEKIIRVCRECLMIGIAESKEGNAMGTMGAAIQAHAEKNGFSVVRALVGHGIGHEIHEDIQVPNYGIRGKGMTLMEGMCIAIEPMICAGRHEVVTASDGWTIKTRDGRISAHFEHTVVVGKRGGDILT